MPFGDNATGLAYTLWKPLLGDREMPTYILLLTLTPEGREKMMDDPQSLVRAHSLVSEPEIQTLGLYGVLGDYDFVSLLEAPDNECVARFSVELGVRAGAHVATMPAIPISRLTDPGFKDALRATVETSKDPDI